MTGYDGASPNGWGWRTRNAAGDEDELLLVYRHEGIERASVNVAPYDDEYVVLFGGPDAPVDPRMQGFDDLAAALVYAGQQLREELER